MNLDELRPILHAYRAQVQQAWSPETAHEGFEGKPGDPAGQCGVTSAWLQRRLLEDHGIETAYCVGIVVPHINSSRAMDHCWLEIGRGVDRIVVDLTIDQCFPDAEFAGKHWTILMNSRHYMTYRRLTADELLADPVQARLALLQEALS